MSAKRDLYIVCLASPGAPRPWQLLRDGELMGYHDTQKGAQDTAVLLCRNRLKLLGRKAELQVHGKDGRIKIKNKNTYGDDPPETRG